MKYHEIIAALTEEPLLITPAAHSGIWKLFEQHRSLSAEEFKVAREGVDMCGEAVELESMEIIDGIAHIPISGPIGAKLGKFEKGAGMVDVADVLKELSEADAMPKREVRGIILDIDSPGGMVTGTPELAERIKAVSKPVFAFTSGGMCSAAYWVGAAADRVFATRSATVGSIGVYCPFMDSSEALKARGLKVEVFASGKYKGLGIPGTSLTDDHREFMQARVLEIAEMFYDHVKECRPDAQDEAMQGQVFMAPTALRNGLIDEMVADKDEVAAML
jgi:signal peptide peptidase SppA